LESGDFILRIRNCLHAKCYIVRLNSGRAWKSPRLSIDVKGMIYSQ
jgi:hypothetical protein